jgi:Sec-independent protein translocase protein TatA
MNNALFLIPLLIIVVLAMFRGRLPHVVRSLHHAQREYRQGRPSAAADRKPPTKP